MAVPSDLPAEPRTPAAKAAARGRISAANKLAQAEPAVADANELRAKEAKPDPRQLPMPAPPLRLDEIVTSGAER